MGAVASATGLSLAALSAVALNDLASRRFVVGATLLVLVVVGRGAANVALDAWSSRRSERVLARERHRVLDVLKVPRLGREAQSDLTWALEQVAGADELARLRASAAVSLLAIVVLYLSAGWLATAITLGLLAVAVPLYQRAGRRSEALAMEYQRRRDQLEARQLEVLRHAPELRGLGALDYGAREIGAYSDREHQAALGAIRVALESSLVTEFLSGVSVGLVAMVVGFALLGGRISLVRALIAVFATAELFGAIRRYGVEFHRRDDASRAARLLTSPVTARDAGQTIFDARDLVTSTNPHPVSLRADHGARVVISGPSGVGKTTLLETLLGWRDALSGVVLRPATGVGVVRANSRLVSGSLRENLTLGQPVDDDAVHGVLRELGLDGERFSDLSRVLLADGRGLSDGERIRVVLARALLQGVATLVIDDVAGLLDETSRQAVRRALERRTTLTIIEASVDRPLLTSPTLHLEMSP
ncbi:MAG: ATP-binding cassette domain-containing protein [Acidobacteriota bacterium]|nr:ATP-binding cassette domain-containing protein [Acidobacteriota bacterium]